MESNDLSKIIGIIMENPDIIDKIRSLAKTSEGTEDNDEIEDSETVAKIHSNASDEKSEQVAEIKNDHNTAQHEHDQKAHRNHKSRCNELLCALKPYVSKQRASAIDTIISVAEVFEILKARPL